MISEKIQQKVDWIIAIIVSIERDSRSDPV